MGPHATQGVSAAALKGLKVVTLSFWGGNFAMFRITIGQGALRAVVSRRKLRCNVMECRSLRRGQNGPRGIGYGR
jgi:hypothetical protein